MRLSNEQQIGLKLLSNRFDSVQNKFQADALTSQQWYEGFLLAQRNRLLPLVFTSLKAYGLTAQFDTQRLDSLHNEFLANGMRNTLLLEEAGLILDALNFAQIPVIGLKGIYLADNIYENVAQREMDDLDFLVRESDIPKAIQTLCRLGYGDPGYFDATQLNEDLKHVPPMSNQRGTTVEIHWALLEKQNAIQINVSDLWQRAEQTRIQGRRVLALCPEDLILHLCIHEIYQHHMRKILRSLVDIDRVIQVKANEIDWNQILQTAHDWHVERIVWLAFRMLSDLFGTPLPESFLKALSGFSMEEQEIADYCENLLFNPVYGNLPFTPDLAKMAEVQGLKSKLSLLTRRIFLPKKEISRVYRVSPNSLGIYPCYFRRFWDLVHSYGETGIKMFTNPANLEASLESVKTAERLHNWLATPPEN